MRRAAESRDIVGAGLAGIEVAAELAFQGARGIILHDQARGERGGVHRCVSVQNSVKFNEHFL